MAYNDKIMFGKLPYLEAYDTTQRSLTSYSIISVRFGLLNIGLYNDFTHLGYGSGGNLILQDYYGTTRSVYHYNIFVEFDPYIGAPGRYIEGYNNITEFSYLSNTVTYTVHSLSYTGPIQSISDLAIHNLTTNTLTVKSIGIVIYKIG